MKTQQAVKTVLCRCHWIQNCCHLPSFLHLFVDKIINGLRLRYRKRRRKKEDVSKVRTHILCFESRLILAKYLRLVHCTTADDSETKQFYCHIACTIELFQYKLRNTSITVRDYLEIIIAQIMVFELWGQ